LQDFLDSGFLRQSIAQSVRLERFLGLSTLMYPLHMSRLAIHLTPRRAILKASHANCKMFRQGFRDAEGSALLDRWAIHNRLDELMPRRAAEQILRLASEVW